MRDGLADHEETPWGAILGVRKMLVNASGRQMAASAQLSA